MDGSRLGIPVDFTAESLHSGGHSGTTIFPMGQGQGATWNVTMAELVGAAIGREARASGVAHGLCPVINVPASVSNRTRDHNYGNRLPWLTGLECLPCRRTHALAGRRNRTVRTRSLSAP